MCSLRRFSFSMWKRFIHYRAQPEHKFEWIRPTGHKTNILVYNPITRVKTPLILRNHNVITWYMCGPTVYDTSHIGHACTYVRFDIIRRILSEVFNYNVVYVMGMTDIDDKIINKSNECGESCQSITHRYENEFFADMDSLNVLRPLVTCKVTNYISEIVAFIEQIFSKNGAYVGKDGSVYFDTCKYLNYGKLKPPQVEGFDANKKSPLDFALWKISKQNEPFWESPWGRGRPGWHIECSAIASTILGDNIDIHSGGIDLSFPHHENEEAQSCCYHDVDQWVNYWLHTGHLHLEGDTKMSKSLQNTISISSLLNICTANQFRMLCLLSDYKKNVVFSNDLVEKASTILKKIEFFLCDCKAYYSGKYEMWDIDASKLLSCLDETKAQINAAFANDFNTPKVIAEILILISTANKMMKSEKTTTAARSIETVAAVSNYIQSIFAKLGISYLKTSDMNNNISNILDTLVEFRRNVRNKSLMANTKDIELLKLCDDVRTKLTSCGVEIRVKDFILTIVKNPLGY
ncbi:PREDICTED: probable cysteine--tRNA ligase, mitochondrial [Ceratosolen solmsi marchali]|uniref:cysteine--tRNA ligase n=1 Tax=Ceratosolen solmsi marchali TaxID=326594 RepID=A0AAJ6YR70_9HYME|nr:PREDICTED: probable cysteine--tRNA ligase, mitochondrial [Ceratosolen solmsi marchali]